MFDNNQGTYLDTAFQYPPSGKSTRYRADLKELSDSYNMQQQMHHVGSKSSSNVHLKVREAHNCPHDRKHSKFRLLESGSGGLASKSFTLSVGDAGLASKVSVSKSPLMTPRSSKHVARQSPFNSRKVAFEDLSESISDLEPYPSSKCSLFSLLRMISLILILASLSEHFDTLYSMFSKIESLVTWQYSMLEKAFELLRSFC